VTLNEQLAEFPAASFTPQMTVVVPLGKLAPETGAQVGDPTPGQLSLTVGGGNVTTAEHWPGVFATLVLAGHVIEGGCVSLIVTVNEQLAEFPAASLTVQLTVVEPFGKVEPDGGVHTGVPAPEQLSETVGVKFTIAEH
jgi:hypothetical protein